MYGSAGFENGMYGSAGFENGMYGREYGTRVCVCVVGGGILCLSNVILCQGCCVVLVGRARVGVAGKIGLVVPSNSTIGLVLPQYRARTVLVDGAVVVVVVIGD
eukprot:38934-Chlamydomonas_euryale.AAC.2